MAQHDHFIIDKRNANFRFCNETIREGPSKKDYPHYELFKETMKFMGEIYFFVSSDKEVDKRYKCLSKDHREGRYFDLKFKAHQYPAGFELQFYQDVVHENPNGGLHDFDKYEKMPYLIKKQLELTLNKLRAFFLEKGYDDGSKIEPKTPEELIKSILIKNRHHDMKSLDEPLPKGPTKESQQPEDLGYCKSHITDRDGKEIMDGDFKYGRHTNSVFPREWHLHRGLVYHDIHDDWLMICGKRVDKFRACELFDLSPDEPRGRVAPNLMPKKKREQFAALREVSNKMLISELRRRKLQKARAAADQ